PTSRSAVSAPIVGSRGRVRGAIVLESDEEGAYGPGSLELLTVYAAGVSGAIERAFLYARVVSDRRLESELVVARRVLAGLLPRETPHLDGFDIAAVIQPCFEVGGDYYDFIPLGKDRWGIAIADVVGKGVPAALLVAAMRASLYSLTAHELALRAVLDRANRFFYESAGLDGKYVTLFYAVMDIQARRLIYVNAGHLPPILLRRVGKVELLEEGGFPLGPFADPRYFEGFARLQTGDLLALYTDGIVEAMDENERHYGHERLVNILRELRSRTAAEICSEVIKDAGRFSHARPPDDQTVLIIKAT
ncbi:MAG: PP2C family protein-serine/threonine phosphatase, partial [Acidobacteriota bacterium]